MEWKTIHVFISSTFNDMHAERDHLVKRVFPELRRWCARRRLKLMDIDLRWGVSAADAQQNKRVVEVCMRNIDKCRPFFLCFLGQRRGWVPEEKDMNPETLQAFPALRQYAGKASVTELEIIHALMAPLDGQGRPTQHARFYFRDAGYYKSLQTGAHRKLFVPKYGLFTKSDADLESFKKTLRQQFSVADYTARWNPELPSPELSGVLAEGRLEKFTVGSRSLAEDVLDWLKSEIEKEYPQHQEVSAPVGSLARELEQQDTQLFVSRDGYIPRPAEEQALEAFLRQSEPVPKVLLSDAGCGKTSLLAYMISHWKQEQRVYYRFVGTTAQSFRLRDLLVSLVAQWVADGLLDREDGEYSPEETVLAFPNLLQKAGQRKPFLLVLDGMDQLQEHDGWQSRFPNRLPEGCHVLLSMRRDGAALPEGVQVHPLGEMRDTQDKIRMVRSYMAGFLKDVDEAQLQRIVEMDGSSNPLYMKILLNELRQHGSFDTLMEKLKEDYGSTPMDAFSRVVRRLTGEMEQKKLPKLFPFVFFNCLACAQTALDGQMFWNAMESLSNHGTTRQETEDLVYGYARELEPFLVLDGGGISLRYDSLRRCIRSLYSRQQLRVAHLLLAAAYCARSKREDPESSLTQALYHIVRAPEEYLPVFFQNGDTLLDCIRHCGAEALAEACLQLGKRGLSGYGELGKALYQCAARLNTCPQTLYMELRRCADGENPALALWLEGEGRGEPLRYLQPLMPVGAAALVQQEYALPKDVTRGAVFAGDWLVTLQKPFVKVLSSDSFRVVNLLKLPDEAGVQWQITPAEGKVYLSCWKGNALQWWKLYTLPELEPVAQGGARTGQGTLFQLQAVEGNLCALFREYQYPEGSHKVQSLITRLVDLTDGHIRYTHIAQGNSHYTFTGRALILREEDSGEYEIADAVSGKVLLRDRFLGRKYARTDSILDGGANHYAACGEYLYLWLSGGGMTEQGMQLVTKLQKFAFTPSGLELVKEITPEAHCSNLQLLGEKYLVAESSGRLGFLDTELNTAGYLDLATTVTDGDIWTGKLHLNGGDVLAFLPGKIQSYSLRQLLGALSETQRESAHIAYSSYVKDGKFYVLAPYFSCTDLKTMEQKEEERQYPQLAMRYHPWNLRYGDFLAGTGDMSGILTVKDVRDLELLLQMPIPDRKNSKLLCAFTYRNRIGERMIGMVTADKTPAEKLLCGEKRPFHSCRLLLNSTGAVGRERPFREIRLDVEVADLGLLPVLPQSFVMEQYGYLVFPNARLDENTLGICVADLETETVIDRWAYPVGKDTLYGFDIQCCENGFLCTCKLGEGHCVYHLDLKELKRYRSTGVTLVPGAPNARKAFFWNRKEKCLQAYDMETHTIMGQIPMERDFFRVQQAVELDGWVILRELHSDVVSVYDLESGKKLFNQRMEMTVEALTADPVTKTLCMVDPSERTMFWQKHEG